VFFRGKFSDDALKHQKVIENLGKIREKSWEKAVIFKKKLLVSDFCTVY